MGISIRDPEVGRLARELAKLRKSNMTEAIAHALRADIAREQERRAAEVAERPLSERLEDLADKLAACAGPNPQPVTKEDIDELWGQ